MTGEFSRSGPQLPRDAPGQREHERDMREEAQRAHEARESVRGKRPWWAFWRRGRT